MYHKKTQSWVKHLDFIILDMICLHVAFVLAYLTRHGLSFPYANPFYRDMAVIFTLVNITVLIATGTMKSVLKRGYYIEFSKTLRHVCIVAVIMTVYLFSTQEGVVFSRITFYLQFAYYLIISYGVRLAWKRVLLKKMRGMAHAAMYFITSADRAEKVLDHFRKNNLEGYVIQGLCILDQDCTGQEICGVPVTASAETVLDYLCDKWVDEIFVSVPVRSAYPAELISQLSEMGMVVHVQMEQLVIEEWQHQAIEKVAGSFVRTLSMTMATPLELTMKRALDIVGGLAGCVLTGLLTLIIGPMIYIKSPGPIFFKQTRVGKNGKLFKMYKFRSMYLDAEARKAELLKENRIKDGMMFKLEFDPRIIGCEKLPDGTVKKGIGNFIRDYSLDEFPQFFNVLKGDLSLCGTRPPTVDEWEKYELHHRARLAIKPGITGLWQISGRSDITEFEQVVELDKKYIREWSMGLDLKILFQTVLVVLTKKGSM